jgi:hypothetical protein
MKEFYLYIIIKQEWKGLLQCRALFPNAFFVSFNISLTLMLIYCKYKSTVAKLTTLHSEKILCVFHQILAILNTCQIKVVEWLRNGRSGLGEFDSPQRLGILLFSTASRPALGPTQPPIQWVPGDLSPGVKRQRREGDRSPPSNAEVENACRYTSTPNTSSWCAA